ncbi:hypothetical protein [Streptomyces sp. NBC_00154]|uniref:hypothetical protein n=1 Tax=Streptomyces sp. NBC_00154 TaxID=2975670 RepID=UPI002252BF80|nr:hypothetical protein [Streptomyces sp. NBC_00154]MCX5311214.1 hypothetical protein [Streptomyces sp. NBC_00154]
MTAAAVRSVADPRPVRASVGRRALQVVLFLGGLLALGLIFGAEAHAAQAPVPPLPAAGTAVAHGAGAQDGGADAAAEPVDVPNAEAAKGLPDASAPVPTHVPAAGPSGAPTAETHARPMAASAASASTDPASATSASSASASTFSVSATSATPATSATTSASVSTDTATSVAVAGARSVVRTTRDTVRYLVRPVGEAVEGVGMAVDSAAGVLPDVWALPARLLLPLTAVDPPAEGRPGHGSAGGGTHAAAPAPRPVCGYTSEADRGRDPVALLNGTSASGTDSRVPAPRYGPAPERAPLDPRGGSGHPSSTEAHGPRGGEQHAVPFAGGTSFGLIRGAGLPATVAPMRDRSGDILEFPG